LIFFFLAVPPRPPGEFYFLPTVKIYQKVPGKHREFTRALSKPSPRMAWVYPALGKIEAGPPAEWITPDLICPPLPFPPLSKLVDGFVSYLFLSQIPLPPHPTNHGGRKKERDNTPTKQILQTKSHPFIHNTLPNLPNKGNRRLEAQTREKPTISFNQNPSNIPHGAGGRTSFDRFFFLVLGPSPGRKKIFRKKFKILKNHHNHPFFSALGFFELI